MPSLVVTFVSAGALFILLQAEFIAMVLIVVYVGGACILTALSTKSQLIFLSQAQDTFLSVGLLMHCAVFPFSGYAKDTSSIWTPRFLDSIHI